MKRLFIYGAGLMLCLVMTLTACKDKETEKVNYLLSITPSDVSMYVDETYQLNPTITPSYSTTFTYESSRTKVATVDNNGLVKSCAIGTADMVITARIQDVTKRTRCIIHVVSDKVLISMVSLSMRESETYDLIAYLDKAGTNITSSCTWSSSDSKVAKVTNGHVVAVGPGQCSIYAKYDGQTATCQVTVEESIVVTPSSLSLLVGCSATLKVNAGGATFSSDNNSVATVTSSGVVTAVAKGSATITVKCQGMTFSVPVSVSDKLVIYADGVEVSSLTITPYDTVTLSTNATASVTWSVTPASVAKVTDKGVFTAQRQGDATVTANCGKLSKTLPITVINAFRMGDEWVQIAPGNVQYNPSGKAWRFAPNAYDIIGDANTNVTSTYTGWLDLFAWGSGQDPLITSQYKVPTTFYCWGYNSISYNGTTYPSWTWYTPSYEEMNAIFSTQYRQGDASSSIRASKSWGAATVNGVPGIIIYPVGTPMPSSFSKGLGSGTRYSDNIITATSWKQNYEPLGVAFFPFPGQRQGSSPYDYNSTLSGTYWLRDPMSSYKDYSILILTNPTFSDRSPYIEVDNSGTTAMGWYGHAVRLIHKLNIGK